MGLLDQPGQLMESLNQPNQFMAFPKRHSQPTMLPKARNQFMISRRPVRLLSSLVGAYSSFIVSMRLTSHSHPQARRRTLKGSIGMVCTNGIPEHRKRLGVGGGDG
jgi:hypothetical protein